MSMGIPSLSKVLGVLTSSFIGKEEVFLFLFDRGCVVVAYFASSTQYLLMMRGDVRMSVSSVAYAGMFAWHGVPQADIRVSSFNQQASVDLLPDRFFLGQQVNPARVEYK